ncbi:MAG: formate dehydrogenase accessory sulfurtransferase FdhD [Actinomycetota bacterium]|nr:formate dehydrogenase accessory sulfurtransferase FdhD [Actinomycetota bacterium]MDD5665695.1 formate dehydrogenase accessory sulfurtransferase FdhD [Actinomycetota bacterium]
MSTTEWHITRHRRGGEPEGAADRVVVELPLEIRVNGKPLVALMRLPGMDKELAAGFCLTEKVIASPSQIRLLKHCGSMEREIGEGREVESTELDRGNVVDMEVDSPGERERFGSTFLVRTGCGGADISAIEDYNEGEITSELQVKEEVIYRLGEELTGRQDVFRGTGGTHGAGIFTADGEAVVVAEDVGRHNALDKAVGWCALRGISIADKVLILSGRVSYEMALKTARVGLPVLVSMAAPTSLGLRVAERAGLTVIGFSDGKRFNVYTHPRRIVP